MPFLRTEPSTFVTTLGRLDGAALRRRDGHLLAHAGREDRHPSALPREGEAPGAARSVGLEAPRSVGLEDGAGRQAVK